MRKRALCAGLMTGAIVLVGAPSAFAATTASFLAPTLTVTGDTTAESITVRQTGANVEVVATGIGAVDPDAGGADCAIVSADVVSCVDAVTSNVVVNAGAGADTLVDSRGANAGPDSDQLHGEAGLDLLSSAGTFLGNKLLDGGADADTLTGDASNTTSLSGGADDDILNAGAGRLDSSDTGGTGNDTFNGSAQLSDGFVAEAGSDTYHGGTRVPAANEVVDDPATFQLTSGSADSISYGGRTDALSVSLDGAANDGSSGEGDNVGADVEAVSGGAGADTLTASSQAVALFGAAGGDVLAGGASDDNLSGGDGSDSIAGNGGDDTLDDGDFSSSDSATVLPTAGGDVLNGGAGNDLLFTDRGGDILVGGAGVDSTFFARPIPQAASVLTPVVCVSWNISLDDVANDGPQGAPEDNVHSDIEKIDTSGGCAFFGFSASRSNADTLVGSAGDETFVSGPGNDAISPGAGADIVDAGLGDDAIDAVDQTTDHVDCGKGNDIVNADLAGAQPTRADVTIDCESIIGAAFGVVVPLADVPKVDTSKPVLRLTGKTVKARTFKNNSLLPVKVTCSKACSLIGEAATSKAVIRVLTGQFKVGSGSLKLGTGTRTLNVKVGSKFMRKYRRQLRTKNQIRKGLSFRVSVTASDAIGIQAQASRTVRVKG